MIYCDIFVIVAKQLDRKIIDNVNALYNLSQTCKDMNILVKSNTNYEVLKKIMKYPKLWEVIYDNINYAVYDNFIDTEKTTKMALESTEYMIPYITNEDINEINNYICGIFRDFIHTSFGHLRNDYVRPNLEAKILYCFIRKTSSNYEMSLPLNFLFSYVKDSDYYYMLGEFKEWLDSMGV